MVRSRASSSLFFSIAAASLRIASAREAAVRVLHSAKALCAASTARRVSAAPQSGTVPIGLPVAGLVTAMVLPLSACTHSPAMKLASRWNGRSPLMIVLRGALWR